MKRIAIVVQRCDASVVGGSEALAWQFARLLSSRYEIEILSSTASDYIRFVRMILNDGQLDGVRILKADTVEAMSRNQIGAIGVPALKTALPERRDDLSFVADGRDKWGLGFLISVDPVAGKRSAGSLSWGGIYNTYFWIDRTRGVAGVIMAQFLPFADRKALAVYDTFERGVYQLADASR